MLKTKDSVCHRLMIVAAIVLGTQLLPQPVHPESPLTTVEDKKNDETEKFLNEKKDVGNAPDGREHPSVLVRYIHSIDGSSDMGKRLTTDLQKATERVQGGSQDGLILSSRCPMTSKEEYGSSEFGNWAIDPGVFDFVVTNTIEGYTKESDFLSLISQSSLLKHGK